MIEKLTSRKLWVALIGVAVGILMILGVDGNEIIKVAGGVVSLISGLGYQFAESKVDAARETPAEIFNSTNYYNTASDEVEGKTEESGEV